MKFSFLLKDFTEREIDPGKLAVIGNEKQLTWKEFEQEVHDFCTFFKSRSWDKLQFPVILYGHKEVEMIVAVYALMKMEVPYIPADIVYPKDRIASIGKIAQSHLVVNCTKHALELENVTEVLYSLGEMNELHTAEMALTPEKPSDPLVYLIFTSGSTGEPKGVQISTEAIQDFTNWMTSDFGFSSHDTFINIALLSFDLSVYELMTFGALGATLLLNDKQTTEDPALLMKRVEQYHGTVWVSTPSFSFMYSRLDDTHQLDSLRYFLFCGELLPHPLAKALVQKFPQAVVYNTYGPTEATVATTRVVIDQDMLDKHNPLPVGYSKPRSRIVIDNDEIVIVGKNVSLGYLNRPDLNEAKFITIDSERAFKTGDNGYLENGMLFFKGRNDDQVKLHGYRIELNEITSKMNDIDFILQAETIALKRNEEVKKIVSLVRIKANQAQELDWRKEISAILAETLPPYMIPSDIKILDNIPLNQNGKADKKALEAIYLGR